MSSELSFEEKANKCALLVWYACSYNLERDSMRFLIQATAIYDIFTGDQKNQFDAQFPRCRNMMLIPVDKWTKSRRNTVWRENMKKRYLIPDKCACGETAGLVKTNVGSICRHCMISATPKNIGESITLE